MTSYPVTMRLGLAVTSHFFSPVAILYQRKVRRSHVKGLPKAVSRWLFIAKYVIWSLIPVLDVKVSHLVDRTDLFKIINLV
jgi:hypothetical protein